MQSKLYAAAVLAAALLAAGGTAHAADMQPPDYITAEPAPPLPPEPQSFNWDRCYGGLQLGAQIVHKREEVDPPPYMKPVSWDTVLREYVVNPVGGSFGAQAGCNFTVGNYLAGIEAEGWYSPSGSRDCNVLLEPVANCMENRKRFNGTLALRGGYVWEERVLTYVKAGITVTETNFENDGNIYGLKTITTDDGTTGLIFDKYHHALWWASNWTHRFAPTIGFGVEYALSDNWTIRGEADFTYIGQYSTEMTVDRTKWTVWDQTKYGPKPEVGDKIGISAKEFITNLKVGMNYMF